MAVSVCKCPWRRKGGLKPGLLNMLRHRVAIDEYPLLHFTGSLCCASRLKYESTASSV